MDLIRCFLAIEIPEDLKSKIDDYIFELKKISPKVKWIKALNLHITLKFLGEIHKELLQQVQNELSDISNIVTQFEMSIRRAGFFPNPKKNGSDILSESKKIQNISKIK